MEENKIKALKIYAPAGNLNSMIRAVDAGADAVYAGFRSASNLRNFAGLNLSLFDMEKGIKYARKKGREVYITVNNYPQRRELIACFKAVDDAYNIEADGIIVSDLGVLDYAARKYPKLKLHLSVQAGASTAEAINFYKDNFNIKTVILPRVVTVHDIKEISQGTDVPLEVFAFGSLCINYEGRCGLSTYITGESTNTIGTCSAPKYLKFHQEKEKLIFEMNGFTMNEYGKNELLLKPNIKDGEYQKEEAETQWADNFLINRRQLCKCRLINEATGKKSYSMQEPVYLNTIDMLNRFFEAGVSAIKIEGRQRSEEYVAMTVTLFKAVVNEYAQTGKITVTKEMEDKLGRLFANICRSYGCYC